MAEHPFWTKEEIAAAENPDSESTRQRWKRLQNIEFNEFSARRFRKAYNQAIKEKAEWFLFNGSRVEIGFARFNIKLMIKTGLLKREKRTTQDGRTTFIY